MADKARQHVYELKRLRLARQADVERQSRVERELARGQLLVWGVPPSARFRNSTARQAMWNRNLEAGKGRPKGRGKAKEGDDKGKGSKGKSKGNAGLGSPDGQTSVLG